MNLISKALTRRGKIFAVELKIILSFFNKYKLKIILTSLLFGALGFISYYIIPTTYVAAGSLFIGRAIQPTSEEFFTYEGYYGQQAATAYTTSIIGLIESEDIGAKVLAETQLSVTNSNLRTYIKRVRVKKLGPQIITIFVKEQTPENAQKTWHSVINNTIQTTKDLNEINDQQVDIQKVSEQPIITETYHNVLINTVAGILLGLLLSTGLLSFKEYLEPMKPPRTKAHGNFLSASR